MNRKNTKHENKNKMKYNLNVGRGERGKVKRQFRIEENGHKLAFIEHLEPESVRPIEPRW